MLPRNLTDFSTPSFFAKWISLSFSSPSPAIIRIDSDCTWWTFAKASSSRSNFLIEFNLPTPIMTNKLSSRPNTSLPSCLEQHFLLICSMSIPLQTTSYFVIPYHSFASSTCASVTQIGITFWHWKAFEIIFLIFFLLPME